MQQQPVVRERAKPIEGLSGILVILFGVMGALLFVIAVSEYQHLSAFQQLIAESRGADAAFERSEQNIALAAMAQLLVYVVTSIVFIMWFYRAYLMAEELSEGSLRYSAGWAIGSWFVPVLNLIRPYHIACDIWRSCSEEPSPFAQAKNRDAVGTISLWWTLFLVGGSFDWVGARLVNGTNSLPSQYQLGLWLSIVGSLVTLAAAAVSILLVKQLTARLERKRARVRYQTQTYSPVAAPSA